MMKFINMMKADALTLSAGKGAMCPDWHIDTSFVVHPHCRSHSGLAMKFCEGRECLISGLEKQKLNTDSSAIAELVTVHQFSPKTLWTPLFLAAQDHGVDENVVLQDNKSATLLEENSKRSSAKRTKTINVCHVVIMDQT